MAVKIDSFALLKSYFPQIGYSAYSKFATKLPNDIIYAYENTEGTLRVPTDASSFFNSESTLEIGGVKFPLAVYVNFVATKTIVRTSVQGKDIGVIEMSNLDNYQVSIKGVATCYEVGEKDFPVYWQNTFKNLIERNESLEVKNEILNRQGIKYLVLESYKPMIEFNDHFAFEMEFLSDENIELELWQK